MLKLLSSFFKQESDAVQQESWTRRDVRAWRRETFTGQCWHLVERSGTAAQSPPVINNGWEDEGRRRTEKRTRTETKRRRRSVSSATNSCSQGFTFACVCVRECVFDELLLCPSWGKHPVQTPKTRNRLSTLVSTRCQSLHDGSLHHLDTLHHYLKLHVTGYVSN